MRSGTISVTNAITSNSASSARNCAKISSLLKVAGWLSGRPSASAFVVSASGRPPGTSGGAKTWTISSPREWSASSARSANAACPMSAMRIALNLCPNARPLSSRYQIEHPVARAASVRAALSSTASAVGAPGPSRCIAGPSSRTAGETAMPDYSRYEFIRVEKAERVATVTLNRPDKLNAVNPGLHHELMTIWNDLAGDREVNAIILTGAGRAFCAGGDVKGMASGTLASASGGKAERITAAEGRRIVQNMLDVEQPIIGAINGDAVGLGATIALLCDIIVASEK